MGIVSTRQKKPPLAAEARGNETCLSTPSRVAFHRKGGTEKIVSLAVSDTTGAEEDDVSVSDGV